MVFTELRVQCLTVTNPSVFSGTLRGSGLPVPVRSRYVN